MANERTDLQGRTVIYTDILEIDKENVVSVINKAKGIHQKNAQDIDYLYNYYKGQQPILQRTKEFNDTINNKVVTNIANEIVSFKVGYLMGEPIQYVNQGDDEYSEVVKNLNEYMRYEDKEAKDKSIVTWNTICGTAYRMIMQDTSGLEDEAPFEIYTLDPRNTFVVYYSGFSGEPLLGATTMKTEDGKEKYVGYTSQFAFEIEDGEVTRWEPHILQAVPIIEYPANEARLGAFEIVLPLLDSINTIQSNRVDGIEQLIQAILVLKGTELSDEDFARAKALGGLKIPADGDAFFISTVLNQSETQTLVDYTYQSILTICGMPNRNGGSSTSDTGTAVIYRDGFFAAEARAKDSELEFKSSEKEFLKIALRISNAANNDDLRVSHIEIRFTRRNYENIMEKTQVLTAMLNNEKIHPKLAFEHCGMFVDPEIAYKMSEEYKESRTEEEVNALNMFNEGEIFAEKEQINAEEETEEEGV